MAAFAGVLLAEGAGEDGFRLQQFFWRELLQVLDQEGEFNGVGIAFAEQFGQRSFQRRCHLAQQQDGDVALPAFQLGQVALGNAGFPGQRLARQAMAGTRVPHAGAELLQVGLFVLCGFGRGCGGFGRHRFFTLLSAA